MRILLVEDDLLTARAVSTLLRSGGHTVRHIHRAEDVAPALAGPPVDSVVLDIVLPGTDGLKILTRLRSLPGWHPIPVVITTALPVDDVANEVREAGLDDGSMRVLSKPFDITQLSGLLTEMAAARRQGVVSSRESTRRVGGA